MAEDSQKTPPYEYGDEAPNPATSHQIPVIAGRPVSFRGIPVGTGPVVEIEPGDGELHNTDEARHVEATRPQSPAQRIAGPRPEIPYVNRIAGAVGDDDPAALPDKPRPRAR